MCGAGGLCGGGVMDKWLYVINWLLISVVFMLWRKALVMVGLMGDPCVILV